MIDSFFGVHPCLLRSGLWRKLKPGERDLYLCLMEESERCCTRELTTTDVEVRRLVGTAPRTLCNARKKLQEHGLIRYKAGEGNRYTYTICNPKTGQPYPGDPRTPLVMPKRGLRKDGELPLRSFSSTPRKETQADSPKSSRAEQETPESYGLPGVFS
jgi:hypothetical protein